MRITIQEFIIELLQTAQLRGIKVREKDIQSECPYHHPKRNFTTFGISTLEENGGKYNCFSCGETGNIFNLIMHLCRCSFYEAKRIFKKRVGIKPVTLNILRESINKIKSMTSSYEVKYSTIELPPRFSDKPMLDYLNDRNEIKMHGVMNVDYIVSKYGLYYCDDGRYRKRVIMPIRLANGMVVYLTNRSIESGQSKNFFPKDSDPLNYLYGLYESVGKKKLILTEGPFDAFQIKSYMIKNQIDEYAVLSNMGVLYSEVRAGIITELFDEVYVGLDHDDAGLIGSKKICEALSDFLPTRNVTELIPEGKDIGKCTESQLHKFFKQLRRGNGKEMPSVLLRMCVGLSKTFK